MALREVPSDETTFRGSEPQSDATYELAKRVLDVFVAGTALILLLPLMLVIAVAIPLESRGPIIYSQERVGMNRRRRAPRSMNGGERRSSAAYGKIFRIYKFRSMVSDAERGTGAVWATRRDPRITRLGRFLRRTHLDELPQLINVLKGEMSVVGPRPERPEIFEHLAPQIPGYADRCSVLPGITGLAQVAHCYDTSLQTAARKVQYDLYYIRFANLLLDIKIMAATVFVMVRADGSERRAHRQNPGVLEHRELGRTGFAAAPSVAAPPLAAERGRESTAP